MIGNLLIINLETLIMRMQRECQNVVLNKNLQNTIDVLMRSKDISCETALLNIQTILQELDRKMIPKQLHYILKNIDIYCECFNIAGENKKPNDIRPT